MFKLYYKTVLKPNYNYSISYCKNSFSNLRLTIDSPQCVQPADNPSVTGDNNTATSITNTIAQTITDIPAGTKVTVNFHDLNSTKAIGTAIYEGGYGNYNFSVVRKDTTSSSWFVDQLNACKL